MNVDTFFFFCVDIRTGLLCEIKHLHLLVLLTKILGPKQVVTTNKKILFIYLYIYLRDVVWDTVIGSHLFQRMNTHVRKSCKCPPSSKRNLKSSIIFLTDKYRFHLPKHVTCCVPLHDWLFEKVRNTDGEHQQRLVYI